MWEDVSLTDLDALRIAKESVANVSIANMYTRLHSAYRIFVQQLARGRQGGSLGEIATYTLGTWTYLYEQQSTTKIADTPNKEEPPLTLDDVLLEYLPPTHPHLPLLLGYTVALFIDYVEVVLPLFPSLILLTNTVSRRGALELTLALFSTAQHCYWEDFSMCMAISRLIGSEDEYLHWLSENMTPQNFACGQGLGHLLRLGREYPSFAPAVIRAVRLSVPTDKSIRSADSSNPDEWSLIFCTELVQLVCTYSIQSKSTKHLIQLADALPSRTTVLPSLALLVHLTIKAIVPDYPNTNLLPLTRRRLTFDDDDDLTEYGLVTPARPPPGFDLLRNVIPPAILKKQIFELLSFPKFASLGIAISRDWKDHINYDDEDHEDPDNLESTSDFLDRMEREYLTETEGVKWRFEDVLAEWVGEWPDGKEIGSTKIPRTKRIVLEEKYLDEEREEEEEWAGTLIKRSVPRSGLVLETPLQSRGTLDAKTERKAVLERLFKLNSIGRNGKTHRTKETAMEETDGGSFLERIGSQSSSTERYPWLESGEGADVEIEEVKRHPRSKKRSARSEEGSIYKDSDPERPVSQMINSRSRKRRRFDVENTDDDSDGSVYENSDLENQSVQSDSALEPSTSDVDELSISFENPRLALRGIPFNRKLSHRTSTTSLAKSLVRESSPILLDDASDDELAI